MSFSILTSVPNKLRTITFPINENIHNMVTLNKYIANFEFKIFYSKENSYKLDIILLILAIPNEPGGTFFEISRIKKATEIKFVISCSFYISKDLIMKNK